MHTTESILFLLGTELTTGNPEDYRLEPDPEPVVADVRDSEPPPSSMRPGSIPPGPPDGPPSSRRAPPSSRSRGVHVPSVFDVVEFGVHSPRTADALAALHDDAGDFGTTLRNMTQNTSEMREAIGNIAVDDRDGPASNRIAVQERIQNRVRIRDLANTLVRYRSVGILNSAYKAPVQVRAAAFYRQAHAMCWELSSPWIDPPFVIEVGGYNSVFQIPVEAASMRDGLMLTPLPREVVRLRRRWGRRCRAPEGSEIALRHPDGTLMRKRPIRDMSFTGLSFWKDAFDDVVGPGEEVGSGELSTPEGEAVPVSGAISFVARDAGGQGDLCGMRLDIEDVEDRRRWREFVARTLYPTTQPGAGHYDAIWRLYQEAGYFNLSGKDPAHFAQLKACFFRNAERIDRTQDLGCVVVWPAGDEVLAAISMLKIYRGSWFVYQLAKIRGDAPDGASSRQVLRDVHLRAYEQAQLDPSLRWLIGYPQVKQIWSRAVHHDLQRRFTTAGLACVVRFRALEVSCDTPAVGDGDYQIDRASPAELEAFLGWLAEARPRPYVEAYDLTPERVHLTENKELWQGANLTRDREIRVARRNGRMVAVAILEDAEEGLHLFRLLDVVRPFPMVKDVTVAAPAIDALVESAKAWYRAKGKRAFCCFIEEDSWLTSEMMNSVEDMGLADMTILSAQLLPEMLEHLIEVTAPRDG